MGASPRIARSLTALLLVAACGGGTLGDGDAGARDSSATDTARDSSPDDSAAPDSSSDTGAHDSALDASPPYRCEPAPGSGARLGGALRYSPADPHPGDTLTVTVLATNGTGRTDAPAMTLHAEGASGPLDRSPAAVEGGAAIYYFTVPDLRLGDLCLEARIGGDVEASARLMVTPRPAGPSRADGVFKVVENHQWTCDEQLEWGNFIDVEVRDADGSPMPGVVVRLDQPATTAPPIRAADTHPVPATMTTGADGKARVANYWPISENGLMVFELRLDDRPSDVATEVTSGWWQDDLMGCTYCPLGGNRNVWGHWSTTVVFQRDPSATEACLVGSDHAGMAACGPPRHIHHDPDHVACW